MAQSSGASIGLPTILTIIFVVLKLTGNIAWSWLWVLSPLWIFALIVVFFVLIALVLGAIFN